jgi:hypothetical protein
MWQASLVMRNKFVVEKSYREITTHYNLFDQYQIILISPIRIGVSPFLNGELKVNGIMSFLYNITLN